jgi:hypothetical protein
MTTEVISPDLTTVLRRLELSGLLHALPERLTLARTQMMPYRTSSNSCWPTRSPGVTGSPQHCALSGRISTPSCNSRLRDASANVTFDKMLLNDLASLRFVEARSHVAIVGPVGVGKTFLAHALGHVACRRAATRCTQLGPTPCSRRCGMRASTNSYEAELRKLIAVDLLIVDDFGLDSMDAVESRDAYESSPNGTAPAPCW